MIKFVILYNALVNSTIFDQLAHYKLKPKRNKNYLQKASRSIYTLETTYKTLENFIAKQVSILEFWIFPQDNYNFTVSIV